MQTLDHELTKWCHDVVRRLNHEQLAVLVRVYWNSRMRTAAGRAFWPNRVIDLNPKLRDCGNEEILRTLKHELAHLLAHERNPLRRIAPHGSEWQIACADLGIPGETACHRLPFEPRRQMRKHAYQCPNCLSVMRRARPLSRPVACYPCCKKYHAGRYNDKFRLRVLTA